MTYDEYKTLAHEYENTDSISRKEELEEILLDAASSLFKHVEKLHRKYGTSTINSSDWRSDRGGYDINQDWVCPFGEREAHLVYGDSWSYGGSCRIGLSVQMKWLDVSERAKLEDELRKKYIEKLTNELKHIDSDIERLKVKRDDTSKRLDLLREEDKASSTPKVEAPNIKTVPIETDDPPMVQDPERPTQEEIKKVNEYLTKHFVDEALTQDTIDKIKSTMRWIGLDPDKFKATFDKDAGELTITNKDDENIEATPRTAISAWRGDGDGRKHCLRGKCSPLGCEFCDKGVCMGIVYPTYPPKYDMCEFMRGGN